MAVFFVRRNRQLAAFRLAFQIAQYLYQLLRFVRGQQAAFTQHPRMRRTPLGVEREESEIGHPIIPDREGVNALVQAAGLSPKATQTCVASCRIRAKYSRASPL